MKKIDYVSADIVLSLCGRDRNIPFIVLKRDGEYLFLSDGKVRKAESPKRKKVRHVRPLSRCGSRFKRRLESGEAVTNREIRKELKKVLWGGNIFAER